ncbi:flagellar hook assembly protein FlgD [Rubrivirga sp.]|uniref:flagellar hook assembly protein FlgD n=1 Tax=Rubrivirga sp. TaxID=1885344 RepID=UPI003C75F7D1
MTTDTAVPAATATPPSASSSPASLAGGADLDRNAFLQLLVAQLRNQDPTSPQDGHEFAAQLAQFSSVEQLTQVNESLQAQASLFAGLAAGIGGLQEGQVAMSDHLSGRIDLQSATALIGQTVDVSDGVVEWDGSGEVTVPIHLGDAAREITVTVRDSSGSVIRTMTVSGKPAGNHDLAWDGALADGSPAPEGTYTVDVSAVGADGAPVTASAVTTGVVERLTVDADGVSLWIGGRRVPFAALLSVRGSSSDTTPPPTHQPMP